MVGQEGASEGAGRDEDAISVLELLRCHAEEVKELTSEAPMGLNSRCVKGRPDRSRKDQWLVFEGLPLLCFRSREQLSSSRLYPTRRSLRVPDGDIHPSVCTVNQAGGRNVHSFTVS